MDNKMYVDLPSSVETAMFISYNFNPKIFFLLWEKDAHKKGATYEDISLLYQGELLWVTRINLSM